MTLHISHCNEVRGVHALYSDTEGETEVLIFDERNIGVAYSTTVATLVDAVGDDIRNGSETHAVVNGRLVNIVPLIDLILKHRREAGGEEVSDEEDKADEAYTRDRLMSLLDALTDSLEDATAARRKLFEDQLKAERPDVVEKIENVTPEDPDLVEVDLDELP